MAKTQNILIVSGLIIFFLIIIGIIIALTILLPTKEAVVGFKNQCSLPSCPSGYSQESIECEGKQCIRFCFKVVGQQCANMKQQTPLTSIHNLKADDKNRWWNSPSLTERTDKCYSYKTFSIFNVRDRSPFYFQSRSNSHEVYTKTSPSGKVNDKVVCGNSNVVISESQESTPKKGDGKIIRAIGKYIPYARVQGCVAGEDTRGSEGELSVSLTYKLGELRDIIDLRETSCNYECDRTSDCGFEESIGNRYCEGNNVVQDYSIPNCNNFKCSSRDNTKTIEICSDVCESGECVVDNRCEKKTCSSLGKECGIFSDGCGGEIICGGCSGDETCKNGVCQSERCIPDCSGKECGSDGCEGICGTCDSGESCNIGVCEGDGGNGGNGGNGGEVNNYLLQIAIAVIIIFILAMIITFFVIGRKK